jgi:hypothetical protein
LAPFDAFERALRQQAHALSGDVLAQLAQRGPAVQQVRDLRCHGQHLHHAAPAPAAGSVAHRATDRTTAGGESGMLHEPPLRWRPGRRRRRRACVAQRAHQPLRDHAANSFAHQIAVDAELVQARQYADRVVGMKGGEDKVAGDGSLHGDGRRFRVADFTR